MTNVQIRIIANKLLRQWRKQCGRNLIANEWQTPPYAYIEEEGAKGVYIVGEMWSTPEDASSTVYGLTTLFYKHLGDHGLAWDNCSDGWNIAFQIYPKNEDA